MAPDYPGSNKDRHFGFMAAALANIIWYAVVVVIVALAAWVFSLIGIAFPAVIWTVVKVVVIVVAALFVLEAVFFARTMHLASKSYNAKA